MKKIFLYVCLCLIFTFPSMSKTLKGGVSIDWDNLSQAEITQDIQDVRTKIFEGKTFSNKDKKEFKNAIKPFRKDINRKENYLYAAAGGGELSDRIVVPFYFKKYLISYGIIYKNDLKTCYYYTALGGLFAVEYFEKDYGEFPVTSYQYKTNGILAGIVHNISDVDQYMYKKDGAFIGRWFEENYYNGSGKIVMTRTLPEK